MVKASDVVNQLTAILPKYTNLFNDVLNINSITCSGTSATATCSAPHNLLNGSVVNIIGALTPNPIVSSSQTYNVVTATTENIHDLTFSAGDPIYGENQTVNISGINYPLVGVYSGNTFGFETSGTLSGGTITSGTVSSAVSILNENRINGYNGVFPVTVISPTQFTYTVPSSLGSPAGGNITALANFRISASADINRSIDAYTKQPINKYWAFVVLGGCRASKNRQIMNDAAYVFNNGTDFREDLVQNFHIIVLAPTSQELAARSTRDTMEDIRTYLFKSMLGVSFPSGFNQNAFLATFLQDDTYDYKDAYYVHQFTFEDMFLVGPDDIVNPADSVAFRSFDMQVDNSSNQLIRDVQGQPNY